MINNHTKDKKMNKKDLKKFMQSIGDIHPVLVGEAGILLLALSLVLPSEYQYMNDKMLIASLACILYSSVFAIAHEISIHKSLKAKNDAEMRKLNEKRAEFKRTLQSQIRNKVK